MISYFIILKNQIFVYTYNKTYLKLHSQHLYISHYEDILIKLTLFIALCCGTSIVYLFVYQIKNLENNLTTVEHIIVKNREKSPFNCGSTK